MIRLRTRATGLGLAVVLVAVGTAGAADKGAGKAKGLSKMVDRLTQLLPPGADDKLKLTDDQKKQVAKLADEYQTKTKDQVAAVKEVLAKQNDAIQKASADKDKAALKTAMQPVKDKAKDVLVVQKDYLAKVRDVLTDDQKTTLDSLTKHGKKKAKKAEAKGA
jgi:Spy/CpxP family protein refolding chaperone